MFCQCDHDRRDTGNGRDAEFLDAIKEKQKFEFVEDICWDLAHRSQNREIVLAICVVHRENAEPTGRFNGLRGFQIQVIDLGGIGDDVSVGYFYAFGHSSGAGRAVQRKLTYQPKNLPWRKKSGVKNYPEE